MHFALYLYVPDGQHFQRLVWQPKQGTNKSSVLQKGEMSGCFRTYGCVPKKWCSLWVSPQNHQTRVPSKKRHARHPQGCVCFSQGRAFFARQTCTCGIEPSIASFPQAHGLAVSEVVFFINHPASCLLPLKHKNTLELCACSHYI